MAFTIEWSENASALLKEITEYYLETAGQRTAARILDAITRRVEILATQPTFGQREPSLEGLPVECRRLLEGRYKIIYFIDGDKVVIPTVFDTRQDPTMLRVSALRGLN
ncbi:MAG: type II toxin-antitoxin system RelE/ParE family toxin [Alistipes sp.]|jgi:plasmid stabilization system protein ParE|nr:type II toxin-antitoxin system RelE/ParE family toxin [Alistipes sp.]